MKTLDRIECLHAIRGGADDLDVRLLRQQVGDSLTAKRLIVDDHDAQRFGAHEATVRV
jgi:hypothetical protein